MVLNVIFYEMGHGESMQKRNSKAFVAHWGNTRLGIASWFTFLLLLFQLLDQAPVADGFPMADEITQAVARAAVAAAMDSGGSSHHHHRGNLMRARENGDGEVDEDFERAEMESSLPRLEAVELLLHKAAAKTAAEEEMEMERQEQQEEAVEESRTEKGRERALWSNDFQRRTSELCRTSATLQCGKRIITLSEGQKEDLSVHMKCDLRDDFLKCIDREKNDCLELAESSILPELPPKEMIEVEQSKLWNVLWTAGGCILSY